MTILNSLESELANQENELNALKSTQIIAGQNVATYVYQSQTYSEYFADWDSDVRVKTFRFRTTKGYHFFEAACIKYYVYYPSDGRTAESVCPKLIVRPQTGNGDIYVDIDVIWGSRTTGEDCTVYYAITVQSDDSGTLTLI